MLSSTKIIGYCQPLVINQGETTQLKISSNGPDSCEFEVLRVICADIDPLGPGSKFEKQDWQKSKKIKIKNQKINIGSFAFISSAPNIKNEQQIYISMYIWPTIISKPKQVIFNWGNLSIFIRSDGKCVFEFNSIKVVSNQCCFARKWYKVSCLVDFSKKIISLNINNLNPETDELPVDKSELKIDLKKFSSKIYPICFAAKIDKIENNKIVTNNHYNGKIERPQIKLNSNSVLFAKWDFSQKINTDEIIDIGPNKLVGNLVNGPMRAATGHNWNGSVKSWNQNKDHYGAIHFHEDDLIDCKWDTNFTIKAPHSAKSGYYIARIKAKGTQSDVPFFISEKFRPIKGIKKNKVLFLAPTATYLSYSNTHVKFDSLNTENLFEGPITLSEDELYLNEHRELGLSHYDTHSDDSGVVFVSERRPILNMRPGLYTFNYINDTHIIKWLEKKGYDYDIVTDEDLHKYGIGLLENYLVVITASHPEYFSTKMWDALFEYQNKGGRHMYLGGNGFYWRVAYSDYYPGVVENRRGISGVRTWEGEPGENHLSFTGEPGGLWRSSGRAPQSIVGNGFCATMFLKSTWFRRSKASYKSKYEFIFKNLNDKKIGDFGYRGGGCVGLEIDRWDKDLGSPLNSEILATSENINEDGLLSGEEFITTTRAITGSNNAKVRADMVFFTTPGGGAVWSTGSIAWATSLLWNNSQNSVSKVTENVLNRFLDNKKF